MTDQRQRPKFLPAPRDPKPEKSGFRFPGPADRVTINGMTGSGKTTFAMWLLGESADFDKKPWIIVDYKREDFIINAALAEGIFEEMKLDAKIPRKAGVFVVRPRAREGSKPVVEFLWSVYEAGRVGLFLDEATMIPELRGDGNSGGPFQSLLSQGRSKIIPVWTLAQRPAYVNRMVYSEANFYCAFKLGMPDDLAKIRKEGIPTYSQDYERVWSDKVRLKPYHSRWFDRVLERSWILNPAPDPQTILNILANRMDEMREKRALT